MISYKDVYLEIDKEGETAIARFTTRQRLFKLQSELIKDRSYQKVYECNNLIRARDKALRPKPKNKWFMF